MQDTNHNPDAPDIEAMSNLEANRQVALLVGVVLPTHCFIGQEGDVLTDESEDNAPLFPDYCNNGASIRTFKSLYQIEVIPERGNRWRAVHIPNKGIFSRSECAGRAVLNTMLMIERRNKKDGL